jgi:hypothetical protein
VNRFEIQSIFTGKDKVTAVLGKMGGAVNRFAAGVKSGFMKAIPFVKQLGGHLLEIGKRLAMFGGIAIGALGVMVHKFAEAGEQLYDFSKATGVGVEAIQEWRYVADQTGVTSEELDNSFMKLAKSIGQARVGTGRLAGFLRRSNPELLKQLKTTNSTGDAFELIINKLATMTNAQDKAALSSLAFGDAGQKFLSMASEGAPAIAKMREEARRMGLITEKNAEDSDRFNDSLATAKMALLGVRNTIAGQLLPVLTPLIKKFTEFVVANRGKIGEWAKNFAAGLPAKIDAIVAGFKELAPIVSEIFNQFKNVDATDIVNLVNTFKVFFTIAKGVATSLGVIVKLLTWVGELMGNTAGFLSAAANGNWAGIKAQQKESLIDNTMTKYGMARSDAASFIDFAEKNPDKAQGVLDAYLKKQQSQKGPAPRVVPPEEKISQSINENNSTVNHEVTLKNQTGASAEVTSPSRAGSKIRIVNTGAF